MHRVANTHDFVQLFHVGDSYEERPIYGVKLGQPVIDRSKPAIVIEAGMHAREWVSVSTAVYTIHTVRFLRAFSLK